MISTATDDQTNGVFNNTVLGTTLNSANVTIDASSYSNGSTQFGDIDVNAPVTWTSANTLTLKAGDNINVNANLTGGTGSGVVLNPGYGGGQIGTKTTGDLTVVSTATITAGTVSIGPNVGADPSGAGNISLTNFLMGKVTIDGVLNTGTLDLQLAGLGINGNVAIANTANTISTLATSITGGNIIGALTVANGSGNLTITGSLKDTTGNVTVTTPGNLILATGALVSTQGLASAADIALASTGGSFINNAGSAAVALDGLGRFLIYSDSPANTTLGGLTAAPVYDRTYASNAPASITAIGNRVLYSLAPTLTITANNQSRTYAQPNPTLTYTITGLVGGDGDTAAEAFSGKPALSTSATISSSVGSYPITVSMGTIVPSDYNYSIKLVDGLLQVNSVPTLTITANDFTKFFGAPLPTFTAGITGFNPGDTASIVSGLNFSTTATKGSPVGTYAIVPSGATAPGYSIKYVDGKLTIDPVVLTITANDASRIYGAANPTFGVTYSGFVNGDTSSVVSGLKISTSATSSSNVGTYAITPSGAIAGNYTITETPGALTVNKDPLTIDVADATKTYADLNPTFSASATGLQLGQSLSQLGSLLLSTTASQLSKVGNYIISALLANPTSLASNYAITLNSGTLSITPRPVTVTATAASRDYGAANPSFTVSFSGTNPPGYTDLGLLDTTGLTVGTAASAASNVGTYAVTASGITDPNFNVTYVPGTLTVNKAPLTITANDFTRLYGDPNPQFTATYTGLASFDNASIVTGLKFSTAATVDSSVQIAAIVPGGATAPNYAITYVPGSLTIKPAPLSFGTNKFSRVYGEGNIQPPPVTGLKLNDTYADLGVSLYGAPAAGASPGNYKVQVGISDRNYVVTSAVHGTLTVEPITVTVSPESGPVVVTSNPNSASESPVSNKQAFLHPQGGITGPVHLAFGLPEAALPVLVSTLEEFLNLTGVSGTEIAQNFKGIMAIRKAMGLKSSQVATDKQIYAYLANIHTDAAKQALLAPMFTDYVMALTHKPPSTYTKADTALVTALLPDLQRSRDQLVTKMQKDYHQYIYSDSSTPNETHLTTLFGGSNHVPWGKFMSDAAGAMVEDDVGNQLAGTLGVAATGAVAGGAAAATIIGAASTIFPFAVTSTYAAGTAGVGVAVGATGSAAATGAAAAGGPAAVVIAAVVGSVVRGIQVVNDNDQKLAFNALVASKGGAIAFAGMDLKDPSGSPVPMAAINRAILFAALTDMMNSG